MGGNGFIGFDDPRYITSNEEVRAGLTARSVAWAFTTTHAYNWHPLTWLSHMTDVELFGLDPAGHHRVSVALHAANAVLLFVLLRSSTAALWPSALVAFLFALHPLRVESVAWASERKDVLGASFWLLTMLLYVAWARRPSTRAIHRGGGGVRRRPDGEADAGHAAVRAPALRLLAAGPHADPGCRGGEVEAQDRFRRRQQRSRRSPGAA